MPPSDCPRCRNPLPLPSPAHCPSCGEQVPAPSPSGPPAKGAAAVRGPHLTGQMPDGKWLQFPLGVRATLGRHPDNAVRLADREVSKEHASIERLGSQFLLRDLGSSNGTFVNGRRIRELKLKGGDEVVLGNFRLTFHAARSERSSSPRGPMVASSQQRPPVIPRGD